mmetsp:Transcript_4060/g.17004  ORF Transcript_4060/g.17004 Transcript_4060/m.17004 type:complete len:386 (+) Transcript_4060:447-1604(+)
MVSARAAASSVSAALLPASAFARAAAAAAADPDAAADEAGPLADRCLRSCCSTTMAALAMTSPGVSPAEPFAPPPSPPLVLALRKMPPDSPGPAAASRAWARRPCCSPAVSLTGDLAVLAVRSLGNPSDCARTSRLGAERSAGPARFVSRTRRSSDSASDGSAAPAPLLPPLVAPISPPEPAMAAAARRSARSTASASRSEPCAPRPTALALADVGRAAREAPCRLAAVDRNANDDDPPGAEPLTVAPGPPAAAPWRCTGDHSFAPDPLRRCDTGGPLPVTKSAAASTLARSGAREMLCPDAVRAAGPVAASSWVDICGLGTPDVPIARREWPARTGTRCRPLAARWREGAVGAKPAAVGTPVEPRMPARGPAPLWWATGDSDGT